MEAMKPLRYVEPTASMFPEVGMPAQVGNASIPLTSVMERKTAVMGAMKPMQHAAPTIK